jgi:bile acid:Na+ symporter, BASS family
MLSRWLRIYGRTVALIGALVTGMLFPRAEALSGFIQYLVMLMLFFSFLDVSLSFKAFRASTFLVLGANLLIAFAGYGLLVAFNHTLALVAFLTGLTPTATAAPVVMSFLGGEVDYVVAALLVTNVTIALLVPFLLPWVAGAAMAISTWDVLQSVLVVVFVPLAASRLVRFLPAPAQTSLQRIKPVSFYLWLAALFLLTAKSSAFVLKDLTALPALLAVAAVALVVCVVNFSLGAAIGGPTYRREASQALGQKNTTLSIWLGLTFLTPLIAMGPAFYVIYHNIYNSFQLYRFQKDQDAALPDEE